MLTLESASASYQDRVALSDISLQIPAGQKVALIGRSGAGKSTLLKLLYGQRPADIALVPQDYGLVSSLSLYHNVYMGQLGRRPLWYNLLNLVKPLAQPVAEVKAVLEQLQLGDKLFEPVAQLSGGQQQRAAIARAMMQGGRILFADEPVSSLDEQQSKLVMAVLRDHFDTLVLAMHDIDLALAYCDRIIGLDGGRITLDAPTASLKRDDLLEIYGE
ncbi:phosphonate ABC transporter ATP-binding protein [Aestuariirhabdus litorea]|uniref:ATP-binding cassette domain-containing protein n=1 Tax=Aestuariirhabdus litorea TaxID=2528527 RepID=A0A3P3VKE2_9GAMM|nr:ATP-binding cassette domain-containing protein [Aestuariirhabdus litorea]RRJ82844.1 ATP-binding cassette domain-containing protein [Aestuariirhabdus litorea]RWW93003.1 ATP-binding cassette domain-containing protein [Endozoicomonadaceae bacterium GTF-13]